MASIRARLTLWYTGVLVVVLVVAAVAAAVVPLHARPKPRDPWSLTVAIDGFNVLNHTNDNAYVGTITSPLFGLATSAQPPRRLQFSLRTKF